MAALCSQKNPAGSDDGINGSLVSTHRLVHCSSTEPANAMWAAASSLQYALSSTHQRPFRHNRCAGVDMNI